MAKARKGKQTRFAPPRPGATDADSRRLPVDRRPIPVAATRLLHLGSFAGPSCIMRAVLLLHSLVRLLDDEDVNVRITAVGALGGFKEERTVAALAKALLDNEESVRKAAVICLKQIGSHEALKPLADALRDSSSTVRWQAAKALK